MSSSRQLEIGALGCTRDGYRLVGVAQLVPVILGLLFALALGPDGRMVEPGEGGIALVLFRWLSLPLGLVVHVLMPIGFCAFAPAPNGPLGRWVRNVAVALLLLDFVVPFLGNLPAPEGNPFLQPAHAALNDPLLGMAGVLPLWALSVGSAAWCLRLRLAGPAAGWALLALWTLLEVGLPRVLDHRRALEVMQALGAYRFGLLLLVLALPFWTAAALGRYIRSSSMQTA